MSRPVLVAPAPMRVSNEIIERCRKQIESRKKAMVRQIILPLIKRYFGFAELGEGFHFGWRMRPAPGSRVGRYAYIGNGFEASHPVTIGDLCMISTHVKIAGNDHRIDQIGSPTRLSFCSEAKVTTFEADVWIGKGAIIRAGVTIGRGAVVGAGAVVTKDVEPYSIATGIPATVFRQRFTREEQTRHDQFIFGQALLKSEFLNQDA